MKLHIVLESFIQIFAIAGTYFQNLEISKSN
jgi:hypothetical protein